MTDALSVTQINWYIKQLLDSDEILQNIYVVGEISNFKRYSSGHLYFSLKDAESSVKIVMFIKQAMKLKIELKDGIKIFVYGYVSCYITAGQYQIYACEIMPAGIGEINEALEKLRIKLSKEGLFDESNKIPIPKFPRKIGVVTSKTGAVIHDITSVMARRYALGKIVLAPVRVQGIGSPEEIKNAIIELEKTPEVDVIIVGRGGGSIEELWAFNDEQVVRTIANCKIAIISAVGHDTDYTLCDFAADVRAATPSAAAELASVDLSEISNLIEIFKNRINFCLKSKFSDCYSCLNAAKINLKSLNPAIKIHEFKLLLNQFKSQTRIYVYAIIANKKNQILAFKKSIIAFDPEKNLSRGYTILKIGDKIIRSIKDISDKSNANLIFSDGIAEFNIQNLKVKSKNLSSLK
ncbi:MAG: exodeoxyribonuclease VII large subunit [Oscillospiraceae bacterium]|jgi:exodeoxyribonuclease VII large subunit|nr:exodeoxyribonuclease VII large subunit [Oscillospiraceae bacterium]